MIVNSFIFVSKKFLVVLMIEITHAFLSFCQCKHSLLQNICRQTLFSSIKYVGIRRTPFCCNKADTFLVTCIVRGMVVQPWLYNFGYSLLDTTFSTDSNGSFHFDVGS